MSEASIARLLRERYRPWDEWSARSDAEHGREVLISQEARRLAHTLDALHPLAPAGRLLEIGTGYLTLAQALRAAFPRAAITGVEHPARPYVQAPDYRKRLVEERIALAAADLMAGGLPFRAAIFDGALFAEVVEHLPPNAVPGVLREIARVLAPGGVLVLTTPNLASWTNRELVARGHSPQQSPLRVIDGTFAHLRLYTMTELCALLEAAGFRIARREFFDQLAVGVSPVRRALAAALAPARRVWPALRDTCVVRAVRAA